MQIIKANIKKAKFRINLLSIHNKALTLTYNTKSMELNNGLTFRIILCNKLCGQYNFVTWQKWIHMYKSECEVICVNIKYLSI